MHVLCFCEKWESGGIESFLVSLFEHMDRTGLTVDLAACRVCPGVYDERLARLGMRVLELGGSIRALNRNVRMFDQLVRAGAYDVVHLNLYEGMGLVFAGVAKKAGVPKVIVHSHNTDLRPSRTRWAKLLVHNCFKSALTRYADDRWAPSRAAAEFLFDGVSRGVRSWTLVKNGIVPERFAFDSSVRQEERDRLDVRGKFVVGCVGRYCSQKNQSFLLDVIAQVDGAVLLLVGADDAEDGEGVRLQERARALGISDRVILHGPSCEVGRLYQAMDVLCVPSLFEGLGIVAVEGQAAGLPVFCSPAVPPEARAGGLFETLPLEQERWIERLRVEMENREADARSRTRAAHQVADAGYDIESVAAQVRAAYLAARQ